MTSNTKFTIFKSVVDLLWPEPYTRKKEFCETDQSYEDFCAVERGPYGLWKLYVKKMFDDVDQFTGDRVKDGSPFNVIGYPYCSYTFRKGVTTNDSYPPFAVTHEGIRSTIPSVKYKVIPGTEFLNDFMVSYFSKELEHFKSQIPKERPLRHVHAYSPLIWDFIWKTKTEDELNNFLHSIKQNYLISASMDLLKKNIDGILLYKESRFFEKPDFYSYWTLDGLYKKMFPLNWSEYLIHGLMCTVKNSKDKPLRIAGYPDFLKVLTSTYESSLDTISHLTEHFPIYCSLDQKPSKEILDIVSKWKHDGLGTLLRFAVDKAEDDPLFHSHAKDLNDQWPNIMQCINRLNPNFLRHLGYDSELDPLYRKYLNYAIFDYFVWKCNFWEKYDFQYPPEVQVENYHSATNLVYEAKLLRPLSNGLTNLGSIWATDRSYDAGSKRIFLETLDSATAYNIDSIDIKRRMDSIDDNIFEGYCISFMRRNPLARALELSIFASANTEKDYLNALDGQWNLYMAWVQHNVYGYGRPGYIPPDYPIGKNPVDGSNVINTWPDCGVTLTPLNAAPPGIFKPLDMLFGQNWWGKVINFISQLFKWCIQALKLIWNAIEPYIPNIMTWLLIGGGVIIGGIVLKDWLEKEVLPDNYERNFAFLKPEPTPIPLTNYPQNNVPMIASVPNNQKVKYITR